MSIGPSLICASRKEESQCSPCFRISVFLYYSYVESLNPGYGYSCFLLVLDIQYPRQVTREYNIAPIWSYSNPMVIPNVVLACAHMSKNGGAGTSVALQECGLQSTTFDNTHDDLIRSVNTLSSTERSLNGVIDQYPSINIPI